MAGCLKRKWEAEYNLMMGNLDKEKKESDTSNLMIHKLDKERKEPENNNLMMDMDKLDKEKNKPDNSNSMMDKLKAVGIWIYRLGIPAPIPVPTIRGVFYAISLMISFELVNYGLKMGLDILFQKNPLGVVAILETSSFVSSLALILIGFLELGWKCMFKFGLIVVAGLLIMALIMFYLNPFWLLLFPFANLRIMAYLIPVEERLKIEECVETKPDRPSASNNEAINQLGHLV